MRESNGVAHIRAHNTDTTRLPSKSLVPPTRSSQRRIRSRLGQLDRGRISLRRHLDRRARRRRDHPVGHGRQPPLQLFGLPYHLLVNGPGVQLTRLLQQALNLSELTDERKSIFEELLLGDLDVSFFLLE